MHKYPQNQSYVGSSGQTLITNVSMTLCSWQIYHQTHLLCHCTTQINAVPTPTVAWARGGGGRLQLVLMRQSPPQLSVKTWGGGWWAVGGGSAGGCVGGLEGLGGGGWGGESWGGSAVRGGGGSQGGIFALRAHCALLLDYVPPEEPPSTPLEKALRIR